MFTSSILLRRDMSLLVSFSCLLLVITTLTEGADVTYNNLHRYVSDKISLSQRLSDLATEELENLEVYTDFISDGVLSFVDLADNVPELCLNQTKHFLASRNESWAQKMIDSWAKPERGILNGNLNWLGAYDECINISTPYRPGQPEYTRFKAQYCTLTAGVKLLGSKNPMAISSGICVPSGCSNVTLTKVAHAALSSILHNSSINVICADTDKTLGGGAIVTILLIVLVAATCLFSTLYDIYLTVQDNATETLYENSVDKINDIATEKTPFIIRKHKREELDATTKSQWIYILSAAMIFLMLVLLTFNLSLMQLAVLEPPKGGGTPQYLIVVAGFCGKFFLCFSFYTNGSKILSGEHAPGSITCLHGLRFISMSWVILGHTGAFSALLIANPLYLFTWKYRASFQAILNATVSVDTFFVLSGLLSAYIFLKEFERKNTTLTQLFKNLPKTYLHRYIRLTPVYAIAVLIWACLIWYINDGPIWPNYRRTMDDRCYRHWYLNFLYVNNLFKSDDNCFGWSWYLANDMQFFLVTPFITYLIFRKAAIGLLSLGGMILLSSAVGVIVAYNQDAGIALDVLIPGVVDTYDDYYYYAPWCRFQTFGVGIIVGYVIWKTKGKYKIPWVVNMICWGAAAALCLAVIYGPYSAESGGHTPTRLETSFYSSVARLAWSIGVAYVIIACSTGNGGPVNVLLSWPGFLPLSKLTYCAYLLHPVGIWIIVRGTRYTYIYTDLTYITTFLVYFTLAFMAAFPFSLMFEAPVMALDKLIFSPKRHSGIPK